MTRLAAQEIGGQNVVAFLDTIAWAEIGRALLAASDDGYNVVVGSTAAKPILFASYAKHPRMYQKKQNSDAAGRYQFMGRYWEHYRKLLALPDFGPAAQDRWCIHLIKECRALEMVQAGEFARAVRACRSRWASLPGAGYGQHEQQIGDLHAAYLKAGGQLS